MELYTAFAVAAQRYTDRIAIEWEDCSWTYRERLEAANVVGNFLKHCFSAKLRNIGLLAPNSPNFCPALFGILGAGHVVVPFNPLLTAEEIARLAAHAEIPMLLYDPLLEEKAKAAVALAGIDFRLVSIPSIFDGGSLDSSPLSPPGDDAALAMILYTSGTTGDPKGVMLSHKNVYANFVSFTALLPFNQDDTFPCILPLFHTYAMTTIVFGALLHGARVILYPQFVPQKVVENILREPNVVIVAVPPMLHMMTHFAPDDIAQKHRLRFVVSGGGPLPTDVTYAFEKKFKHELLEGYGLTEAAPVVAVNPPGRNKIGTIGPSLPGIQVEVRNETGQIVGVGEVGELCVRGDNVMMGYYKNPTATQAAFHEGGWLRTGDLAKLDEEGYIKIVGRLKDVIVSGGDNIYPREIEETLLRCPGVLEAAIVAKPNKLRSEVPHAFIVRSEEARDTLTEPELRKFCRRYLAEYKIPDGFTFIEQMPKTAKGTIHKDALKRQYF